MRNIGYARISTDEQSLGLQLDALHSAGCATVFEDKGVSGASTKRNGLAQALAAITDGDQLVVWRLDRLGRSLPHLIETVSKINALGADFRSLTEEINTRSAGGKLIFHIMGALAEFERSLIVERTIAGQQAAKRRGVHIGPPFKLAHAQITHAMEMIDSGEKSMADMASVLNVDKSTLWRALKKRKESQNA